MQADFKVMVAKSASIIKLMEEKIVLNHDVSVQSNKELQVIHTLQEEAYSNADLRREVLMTEIHGSGFFVHEIILLITIITIGPGLISFGNRWQYVHKKFFSTFTHPNPIGW